MTRKTKCSLIIKRVSTGPQVCRTIEAQAKVLICVGGGGGSHLARRLEQYCMLRSLKDAHLVHEASVCAGKGLDVRSVISADREAIFEKSNS